MHLLNSDDIYKTEACRLSKGIILEENVELQALDSDFQNEAAGIHNNVGIDGSTEGLHVHATVYSGTGLGHMTSEWARQRRF